MKIELICRVCLKEGKLRSIFDIQKSEGGQIVNCTDMLVMCASVTINKMDGYPPHICDHCFKKLYSAYKFRHLCEKSFNYLKNYFMESKPIEIKVEKQEEKIVTSLDYKDEVVEKEDYMNVTLVGEVKLEDSGSEFPDDFTHDDDNGFDEEDNVILALQQNKKNLKLKKTKMKVKKSVKKNIKDGQYDSEILKCQYCPKIFKYKYRLLAHEDSHIGLKRYFCEICQKAYRNEKDHKNMHKRGFDFKCEICSKCFNTKSKLAVHIETHNTNREKMVCGMNGCTKVFMSMVGLRRHRTLHDGERNYVCHLCSGKFLDKYALEIHLRRHNNERRYQCTYCDKKFYQSSAKTAHEKRHTNTRNHPCPDCDQSFYTPANLRRHLLSHTKILDEVCRFCSKRFARRDNRRRHEIVMHGVSGNSDEKTTSSLFN